MMQNHVPPLSLYIHMPWCIRKCPYCDFNSHKLKGDLPEKAYISALLDDLNEDLSLLNRTDIKSIFIGGGTPSLLSPQAYELLFDGLKRKLDWSEELEITLEANPGSVDQQRFKAYRQLGINRLSLGVQSFSHEHLKALGRIHDSQQAKKAIEVAHQAGFDNFNIDLMFGLPNQSVTQALYDLEVAIAYRPSHLSWYQLTIERNTEFYKKPPVLPEEELLYQIETAGKSFLNSKGYQQYEISAFCQAQKQCKHNLNYWTFGDYLGIGAGAHSKLTIDSNVIRLRKKRQPNDYIDPSKSFVAQQEYIATEQLAFEFMLGHTRLHQKINKQFFERATGLAWADIHAPIQQAIKLELLLETKTDVIITAKGYQYLNNLQALFLDG